MLLEGQLDEATDESPDESHDESPDESPLPEESELAGSLSPRRVSTWSDDEDDSPPPPPLQEITRRLK